MARKAKSKSLQIRCTPLQCNDVRNGKPKHRCEDCKACRTCPPPPACKKKHRYIPSLPETPHNNTSVAQQSQLSPVDTTRTSIQLTSTARSETESTTVSPESGATILSKVNFRESLIVEGTTTDPQSLIATASHEGSATSPDIIQITRLPGLSTSNTQSPASITLSPINNTRISTGNDTASPANPQKSVSPEGIATTHTYRQRSRLRGLTDLGVVSHPEIQNECAQQEVRNGDSTVVSFNESTTSATCADNNPRTLVSRLLEAIEVTDGTTTRVAYDEAHTHVVGEVPPSRPGSAEAEAVSGSAEAVRPPLG